MYDKGLVEGGGDDGPILTRNPETQKDQENGRKEDGMISKTQRSAI